MSSVTLPDDPGAAAPAASTDTPAAGAAAPAVETAGPAAAAEQTSLLNGAPATETAPAVPGAETTAPAVAPAAETLPAATEEIAAPTYTDFTFPEGVSVDPEMMKGATELFAKNGFTQEVSQSLVDYHTTAMQKFAAQVSEKASADQWKIYTDTNNQLIKDFEADPDIGGNRKETTLNEARFAMSELAGGPQQLKALKELHANSIAGNHPAEIRAWAEAGRRIRQVLNLTGKDNWNDAIKSLQEPGKPPPGLGPRAPGNNGSRPADRRYGTPSTTRT